MAYDRAARLRHRYQSAASPYRDIAGLPDGTPRPWEFKRVWHLEPSLNDPDTVYAGVEDAAPFRTTDGGLTWRELPGLRSAKGHLWQPGAGGMGPHTILLNPDNANRIFVAISAAGVFRTDDAGNSWRPVNRGLRSAQELADPNPEVGFCVHRIAMHPSRPNVLFMQKHWDVNRSDDAGDSWYEVSVSAEDRTGPLSARNSRFLRASLK